MQTSKMQTQIVIKSTTLPSLTEMLKLTISEAVEVLSAEYGFERDAALTLLEVASLEVSKGKKAKAPKKEKVVVPKKPAFLLPWCGSTVTGWCGALRYNRGLFTQCSQKCKGGSQFCGTCLKHVSIDGIPQYGLASERNNEGWKAPNGKSPVNYANVMDKLKNGDDTVTKEMAIAEAAKFDWTIPEEQFVKSKARKGRPAKAKAEKPAGEKKQRGRPKKQKPVTNGGAGDDLIAQLVAQATVQNQQMAETKDEEKSEPVSPSTATEEDTVETTDESEPTTPDQPTKAVKPDAPKKAKKSRKPKMTEEEKAAAKLAKQQEREAAKLAKQQEREAAKAKAKAEKDAAKAKVKAEKDAAKAKAKAEKDAAKALAKAEKEAAKANAKAEKTETAVVEEHEVTPEKLAEDLAEMELQPESPLNLDEEEASEEEEEEVKVEAKTGADGKSYMVDADGNVYDEEGYEIGTWDEETRAVVVA